MDPSTDPPPAAAAEPPAYIAYAANPTPLTAPNNHPPYAEMITAAITALKEKDGSSRQAIAKYIEKAYTNLPATHSALLTHQLKRLKNSGHLVMVKHSYMLPRSVSPLSSPTDTGDNGNASSSGPKRGPGRPPKPKMMDQPSNAELGPMLISLGLVDGSPPVSKKGPGRPPKAANKSGLVVGTELGGLVGNKRARGRPPRPKSMSLLMGQTALKDSPGRPPRAGPIASAAMKASGRPRGRPPKNAAAAVGGGAALVSVGGGGDGGPLAAVGGGGVLPGKRRGRRPRVDGVKNPRKVTVGVFPGKRRGRRPKADGVMKPRKLTGKPLGRPRKNALISGIQAAAPQPLVAYEDLKIKFEHFQSRIKHAVNTVKPHLNNEAAFGALLELEELATMDLSVPLNVPVQVPLQEPLFEN